jgi:hypothetical protein
MSRGDSSAASLRAPHRESREEALALRAEVEQLADKSGAQQAEIVAWRSTGSRGEGPRAEASEALEALSARNAAQQAQIGRCSRGPAYPPNEPGAGLRAALRALSNRAAVGVALIKAEAAEMRARAVRGGHRALRPDDGAAARAGGDALPWRGANKGTDRLLFEPRGQRAPPIPEGGLRAAKRSRPPAP